ncbi:hypothetical protein EDM53_00755 [Rickettsiales endosymbiont of Peranema trichophorum]|uniref:outer membrane protein n=1 Tax=Rickettsiales endosymbiont of Peranema trichophorum TaxID=2486577 RepID=UPI0010234ACB|nr:outer membrane beta-barrel protein [Rickettsiales endosymbiont of Peranema trichophorum]RZI47684.1 hypothetical protein EDM53_00755 [Rickettsiales endosymbiont of Peranema trichophorum]
MKKSHIIASILFLAQVSIASTAFAAPASGKRAPTTKRDKGFYVGLSFPITSSFDKFRGVDNGLPEDDRFVLYYKKAPSLKSPALPSVYFGYQFNKWFAADINAHVMRLGYKCTDVAYEKGKRWDGSISQNKITSQSLFLNAYYQGVLNKYVSPYLSLGVGYARNNGGSITRREFAVSGESGIVGMGGGTIHNLAWNVSTGMKLHITGSWNIDLKYGYYDLGNIKSVNTWTSSISAINRRSIVQKMKLQQLSLGLSYYL